jgi:Fic family protein
MKWIFDLLSGSLSFMTWNWQLNGWPAFEWNAGILASEERRFIENAAVTIGARRHLEPVDRETLDIELLSRDALSTSAIEGEMLDRASVQSSLRKQLGLSSASVTSRPAEAGIAEIMADLYRSPASALTHGSLFAWHRMVMNGRRDIAEIGGYRRHSEAMQIVSGGPGPAARVHFEAPPSSRVPGEMAAFLDWFARTAPAGEAPLPPLARAGVAHLWFESIHPFEDGNGRIGRAIAEKALAQGTTIPSFTGLSGSLLRHRKAYYAALEQHSMGLQIDGWLHWFSTRVLEAQADADRLVRFLIEKARLLRRLEGTINPRQEKALLRMFAEGPTGFQGGMSAANYTAITGTASATVTRDLADLVDLGVLRRSGERKGTRYWLVIADAEETRGNS